MLKVMKKKLEKTKKDKIKGKETLITLMGKDKARKKSQDLINRSIKILEKVWKKSTKSYRSDQFYNIKKKIIPNVNDKGLAK